VGVEYTGSFVMLKKDGDSYKCLGVYNPDIDAEENEPEGWDLCLPIPDPETVSEFGGF